VLATKRFLLIILLIIKTKFIHVGMAINNKTNMFSIYLQLAYCSLLAINMGESLKLTRK